MGFFSAVKRLFGQKDPTEKVAPDAENVSHAESGAKDTQTVEPLVAERRSEQAPESSDSELAAVNHAGMSSTQDAPVPERLEEIADVATSDAECGTAAEILPAEETALAKVDDGQVEPDASALDEEALLVRLRQAEPRLSAWLGIILEDQDETSALFWERLRFFLRSLEAPEQEIEAFISDFSTWLERMDYSHVDEFRSELQYRLALALDLEDEEDERNRLMLKLAQGLAATRAQLGMRLDSLFAGHGELNDAFWEEMEEMFIMADLGYDAALEIVARLKSRALSQKVTKAEDGRQLLLDELDAIFRQEKRIRAANKPEVILMMGVNGAGKTTTIAKLAYRARMEGKKVLVAAADTFRAAAIEQLQVWAERAGADFYAKPAGSDPASVAWEAMEYAQKNDIDIVFVDTAGRLQTRVNLMEELGKIRQVLAKKQPGAPHRSMLVLDATTGQNALSQAKLFREAAGADEIALTKLDGTAKGGVAIAVAMQEGLPITFVGLGEKMEDLRPFNGRDFARALLGEAA